MCIIKLKLHCALKIMKFLNSKLPTNLSVDYPRVKEKLLLLLFQMLFLQEMIICDITGVTSFIDTCVKCFTYGILFNDLCIL